MENKVRFGDGVLDAAKADANSRMQNFVKSVIDALFDYAESKAKQRNFRIRFLRLSKRCGTVLKQ